jgi:hypothetical protein
MSLSSLFIFMRHLFALHYVSLSLLSQLFLLESALRFLFFIFPHFTSTCNIHSSASIHFSSPLHLIYFRFLFCIFIFCSFDFYFSKFRSLSHLMALKTLQHVRVLFISTEVPQIFTVYSVLCPDSRLFTIISGLKQHISALYSYGIGCELSITVAARSKAQTVFARTNT